MNQCPTRLRYSLHFKSVEFVVVAANPCMAPKSLSKNIKSITYIRINLKKKLKKLSIYIIMSITHEHQTISLLVSVFCADLVNFSIIYPQFIMSFLLVRMSTQCQYCLHLFQHNDSYSATKSEGEALVIKSNGTNGLLTCCIRPSSIFGPGDKLFVPSLVDAARAGKLKVCIYSLFCLVMNLSSFLFSGCACDIQQIGHYDGFSHPHL